MLWLITTMMGLELSHIGGAILWYLIFHTNQSSNTAISHQKKLLKIVMMQWVMRLTMNLETLISTVFILHHAQHRITILYGTYGSRVQFYIGDQGMIHVLKIMQKSIIIVLMCRKQCMQTLQISLTSGLLAGVTFDLARKRKIKKYSFILNLLKWNMHLSWSYSDVLIKNWKDTAVSVLPIYRELIAAGLRIWVFRYSLNSCIKLSV